MEQDRASGAMTTIATFREAAPAHVARATLEAHGIQAVLADEHHTTLAWHLATALGGVKLRVPAEQRDEALAILARDATTDLDALPTTTDDDGATCPACHSTAVALDPVDRRARRASALVGVPFTLRWGAWRCADCGHRWTPRPVATNPLALIGYVLGVGVFLLVAVGHALRLLPRRLAALAGSFQSSRACWACGTSLVRDAKTCPACDVALPAPLLHERYIVPGRRYDAACMRCHTPYRVDDYRPDVAWTCRACRAPIAR